MTGQTSQPAPVARLPKVHANPQDEAEKWLGETYENADDTSVGYDRGEMIDAYHAGWRRFRDLAAAAIEREPQAALRSDAETAELLRADLADAEAQLARWPRCPEGCGCRLGTEDADARECACDGPCCMECRENGYPDAPSYRDIPRENPGIEEP